MTTASRARRASVLLPLLLSSGLSSPSRALSTPMSPAGDANPGFAAAVDRGRRLARFITDAGRIPGMAIAVWADGRPVWSEGFGVANLETGTPVGPQTRFRIASISKNLTGSAVARLVESGRLDLDAPIERYVADLTEAWRRITPRMLASHTSGIAHYRTPEDALNRVHYASTRAALEAIAARPMAHAPGEAETYSSFAYTVLAAVLEGASGGVGFLALMDREVFQPLGMSRTVADEPAAVIPGRTGYYAYGPQREVINAPSTDLSDRWAGSGFLSTAEDLARFGAAHVAPGYLSAESLRLLVTPAPLPGGGHTREGLGWGPREDWSGRRTLWGNGRTPGSTCGLLVYPGQRLVIAVVMNIQGAPLDRGDLQALAEPFLVALEGNPLVPPPSASQLNALSLRARMQEGREEVPATLTLRDDAGCCGGLFRVDAPAQPFETRIVDVWQSGRHIWIMTIVPADGLVLPIRLTRDESGYRGEVLRTEVTLRSVTPVP